MDQNQSQTVGQLLPMGGAANWLHQLFSGGQEQANRQGTPNSRATAAAQAVLLRRQRVAAQLQANAQAAGRAPLSQNEIDEALASYGLQ